MNLIYNEKIEFRSINILRLQILNKMKELNRNLLVDEFLQQLKMVIPNISKTFVQALLPAIISDNKKEISYNKICELIIFFKYKPSQISYNNLAH